VVDTGISAEQFFSRLALEHQVGMLDSQLLATVMSQTRVYQGATCPGGTGLDPLNFPGPLPGSVSLAVSPSQLAALAGVAEELSGQPASVVLPGGKGQLNASQFAAQTSGIDSVTVQLKFDQSQR
jgi:hypothetical protein